MKVKTRRFAVCALACAMTAAAGALLPLGAERASAAEMQASAAGEVQASAAEEVQTSAAEAANEPRALFAHLTLKLEGGNGEVWATAKNVFTLFPGTVEVQVELYSSTEYPSSYEEMTLERRIYKGDLNQGKELVARASTDGEQRYWMARMTSNVDGSGKQDKLIGPMLFDGNGNLIESWEN